MPFSLTFINHYRKPSDKPPYERKGKRKILRQPDEPTPWQKRDAKVAQLEERMLSLIADSEFTRAGELAQCILALKAKS